MIKQIFKSCFIFFVLAVFIACAKQGAPGGGPVDKTPPFVVLTIPKTDSVHIPLNLEEIYIEFSERMNEGSVSQSIFISPPLEYEAEWSRSRKLKLVLDDTLLNEQTYVVSIGTEVSDEHNNQMTNSYQFAFSTGDKIDHGSIAGRVYGIGKKTNCNIFAFIWHDSTDIDFTNQQPRYISQSGKDGAYSLNYLKPDIYRVFAVLDQNHNLKIDADYERIGIPLKDIELTDNNLNFSGLDFRMTRIDTIAPFIVGVRPINDRYLQVRLSESILLDKRTDFSIVDSLSLDTLQILGRSVNFESTNIIDVFTVVMDTSARYRLFCSFLEDSSGNINTGLQKIPFLSKAVTDTTAPKVIDLTPADSAKAVHPKTPVYLEFSHPVNWTSVDTSFTLFNSVHDTIAGVWDKLSEYDADFIPNEMFITDSSYTIQLQCGGISDLWGKLFEDSLIHHYFTIISSRELGEISGTILADSLIPGKVYISFTRIGRAGGGNTYNAVLDSPEDYRIEKLPDGQYRMSAFWDLNGDKQFSAGGLFPFQFSEPFAVRNDTIKVRKRWETANINLRLPDPKR